MLEGLEARLYVLSRFVQKKLDIKEKYIIVREIMIMIIVVDM